MMGVILVLFIGSLDACTYKCPFVGGGSGNAGLYTLTELYPEDYGFRSGLAYEVQTFGDVIIGGVHTPKLIKTTRNYWSTYYPFQNPGSTDRTYNYDTFVEDNVGFKAKILRYPKGESYMGSGRVSYTLALIPYLEASETIVNDKDQGLRRLSSGQITRELDPYGNEKEVENLGITGRNDKVFTKTFESYNVKNPYYIDGSNSFARSSEYLNLQHSTPLDVLEVDGKKTDNRISKVDYVYESNPLIRYYFDKGTFTTEQDAKSLLAFYGQTGIPVRTTLQDINLRILGEQKMELQMQRAGFEACKTATSNPINHIENDGCLSFESTTYGSYLGPFDQSRHNLAEPAANIQVAVANEELWARHSQHGQPGEIVHRVLAEVIRGIRTTEQ